MREINRARVTRPMKRGEAVLPNVLGLGVDIIITSGLLEEVYSVRLSVATIEGKPFVLAV